MRAQANPKNPPPGVEIKMNEQNQFEIDISLSQLLKILWKRKAIIIFGTITVTVLAFIITILMPKSFKCRGLISLTDSYRKVDNAGGIPGMRIPEYKSYSSIYLNPVLFKQYLLLNKISENMALNNAKANAVPIYAYGNNSNSKNKDNTVINLRINTVASTPEQAKQQAILFGDYVCVVILNSQIENFLLPLKNKLQNLIVSNEYHQRRIQHDIDELKKKEEFIVKQLYTIKGIGSKSGLGVLNIDEATEKYLPPPQQLMAVKVEINTKEKRNRQFLLSNNNCRSFLAFYKKVAIYFDSKRDFLLNKDLLKSLIEESEKFFPKDIDMIGLDSIYKLRMKFAYFQHLSDKIYRFVSFPELPEKAFKPNKRLIVTFSFLFSLFFFVVFAFLMHWWEYNKKTIMNLD